MPFKKSDPALARAAAAPSLAVEAPVQAPSLLELVGAAWRTENALGSLFSQQPGLPRYGLRNPDFDPAPLIPEDKQEWADRYWNAINEAEVQAVTRQIDREQSDRATRAAGGWLSVAADIGAGILDPINLIPVGGAGYRAIKAGNILRGALLTASVGAGAMTATEAALHSTQQTRTLEESVWNVAGGTFLSGVLGGGLSAWSRAVTNRSSRTLAELGQQLEQELNVPAVGRYSRTEVGQALDAYHAARERADAAAGDEAIVAARELDVAKGRYEEMVEQVHEPDLLEPGSIEISADALARDTGVALEEADDNIVRMGMPKRSRRDFLGVEAADEAPAAPAKKPKSKRRQRTEELDNLEQLLSDAMRTRGQNGGEMTADEFLGLVDIKPTRDKKTGKGTGWQAKIPYGGTVKFPDGATAASLGLNLRRMAMQLSKGPDGYENALRVLKPTQDDVLKAAVDPDAYDEIAGEAAAQLARLDAEGEAMMAARDAGDMEYLVDLNRRANDALDQLANSPNRQAFLEADDLFEDPDFAIMPAEFFDEYARIYNDVDTRLTQAEADSVGTPAGQQRTVEPGARGDAEPERSVPPADEPDPTGGSADGGGDPPRGVEPPEPTPTGPGDEGASATLASLGEQIKDEAIIKSLPLVNKQDPLIRLMLAPSLAARRVIQRLGETPLKYAKNALGVATHLPVEAVIRQSKAPLAFALKHLDEMFTDYRLRAKGQGGTLSKTQFHEEVAKAMRRGDAHPIPQVAAVAKRMRQDVFDPFLKRAQNLGLIPEGVETRTAASYLTRVYDIEKIIAQRDEFFQRNMTWLVRKEAMKAAQAAAEGRTYAVRSESELADIADQVVDRILGTPEGRLAYDLLDEVDDGGAVGGGLGKGNKGKAKPLHNRVYDIPDALVEDFLVNDIEVVAKIYERSMAPDLALMEEFGSLDLAAEIQAVRREYSAKLHAAKTEAERVALKRAMDQNITDIAAIRDRLRGMYALPADTASGFVRAGRVLRVGNFLSLMGGVVISSVPDMARPMMVHGLSRYLRDGLVPLVTNFKAFRASAEEVKLAGTALDMLLDGRMSNIAELMDDYGRTSKFERLLAGLGDNFGKVAGIAQWNATLKQWAGMMTQSRMIQAALDTKAGTVAKKEVQALAAGYIDPAMARRIADQFEQWGETQGTVRLPNTGAWTDREAVRVFRAALARDVDRIIVTPGQDKPLWLSTEWGKLFGQFKSFFISATQRVLLAGLQDRDLGVLNGLVFATGLGAMTALFQAKLARREISTKPEDLILEGLDRAGVGGWLFEVNAMAEKLTRGHVGLSALTGKEPMSRYASRNVIDALVGPSAGRVGDLASVTGSTVEELAKRSGDIEAEGWKESDTRALRRLVPFQNLWYLRWLFDAAQDGLTRNLGIVPEADTAG